MAETTPVLYAPGQNGWYFESHDTYGWDPHWRAPSIVCSHNRVMHAWREAGYDPHFHQPDWDNTDPYVWAERMAEDAIRVAAEQKANDIVLAGFSMGALIAVLAAKKLEDSSDLQVRGVVASSMTSLIGEANIRRAGLEPSSALSRAIPEALLDNLCDLKLPDELQVPVLSLIGMDENDSMREFHAWLQKKWPNAVSIKHPGAHNPFDEGHLRAIASSVRQLLSPASQTEETLKEEAA
jgi:hypothetical protein